MKFVLFVEGHTEQKAVPSFLKRWLDPRLRQPVGIRTVRFDGWGELPDCDASLDIRPRRTAQRAGGQIMTEVHYDNRCDRRNRIGAGIAITDCNNMTWHCDRHQSQLHAMSHRTDVAIAPDTGKNGVSK